MKISALALEAVHYKLRANFNDNLEQVATSTYGIKPFRIDFPESIYAANSKSFYMGQISPEDIDALGPSDLTRASLFVPQSDNSNFEKPRDFSGLVRVGLDFHLQWISSNPKQNLETTSLAVEDAVTETLQSSSEQNWGAGVTYNGNFSCLRGAVMIPPDGKGSYRQMVAFQFTFQVDV